MPTGYEDGIQIPQDYDNLEHEKSVEKLRGPIKSMLQSDDGKVD